MTGTRKEMTHEMQHEPGVPHVGEAMNPVEVDRAALAADPRSTKCPGCFGWGFPIFWWNGREARNTAVKCPDCAGTGRRPTPAISTP